jgi:nucleoside-diphosphate-sugar epimerase
MTVLVTGGTGFVASNIARQLLADDTEEQVVVLDLAPPASLVTEFFEGSGDRIRFAVGDVTDPASFAAIPDPESITHVIHAATVTHHVPWELERPRLFVDVNVGGTVNVFQWARELPRLRSFVYISSGAVYGYPLPNSPTGPQPEEGPFNPPELYAVTKFAAERISLRLGELNAIDTRAVRFSGVFGPMERPTGARVSMSFPYAIARSLVEERPLRLTGRTLEARGDFIGAEDVSRAVAALVVKPEVAHRVYNVAFGRSTGVDELLAAAESVAPDLRIETVEPDQAELDMDPEQKLARWNGYSIDRIAAEIGWRPRPLDEQLDAYFRWVRADPERRCPPTTSKEVA